MTPPPAALAVAAPQSAERPVEHPLEASDRLAWQATAAVGLLERFGDLVLVALEAVGDNDDALLAAALAERERLLGQLEPLLADLAAARLQMSQDGLAGPNARRALATILQPVDQALRYANVLHSRLTDELPEQPAPTAAKRPKQPTRPSTTTGRPVRRGHLALVQ